MIVVLVFALALLGLAVILAVRAADAGRIASRRRLAEIEAYGFGARKGPIVASPALRERLDKLAGSVGEFANRHGDREREAQLRRELYAAGLYTLTPRKFLGYRLMLTIVLPAAWIWLSALAGANAAAILLIAVIVAGLGWVVPGFTVHRRATQRLEQIDYEMPEMVDLLVTAVEGGLSFAGSLQMAVKNFEGPLGQELRIALQEQSMGLTINEALTNVLTRTDTPAVRSFVQAVVQGETLGVSIGKILRDLAEEMRRRRRQAAEERAHKAGTKILFPLVLLIFPALFVVTLLPVLIEFGKGLGGG